MISLSECGKYNDIISINRRGARADDVKGFDVTQVTFMKPFVQRRKSSIKRDTTTRPRVKKNERAE